MNVVADSIRSCEYSYLGASLDRER